VPLRASNWVLSRIHSASPSAMSALFGDVEGNPDVALGAQAVDLIGTEFLHEQVQHGVPEVQDQPSTGVRILVEVVGAVVLREEERRITPWTS